MKGLAKIFSRKNSKPAVSELQEDSTEQEFGSGIEGSDEAEQGRRNFLLRCGKYAAFTAPVVYTLLAPQGSIYAASGT